MGDRGRMSRRSWIGSALLILVVLTIGVGLAAWKRASLLKADAAAASTPEPAEAVTAAVARQLDYGPNTTSIGTVLALQSITLSNELAGTVREVRLIPGEIVEPGALLVALDVSVEQADLKSEEAQAALAQTTLNRVERLSQDRAVSQQEVDQRRAERDVALAAIARTKAIIARKTIRAPFRARVGITDVHPGQYLKEGTELTTLQGVGDGAHVDFTVAQRVASGLKVGDRVDVFAAGDTPIPARIVAIDARVDPATRNAMVRAKIDRSANPPAPGASVRVRVPIGSPQPAVVVPASALRKGPDGDHVFVLAPGQDGKTRAQVRGVQSGPLVGDDVVILDRLAPGELVATSGSFKLRDGALVVVQRDSAGRGTGQ